MATATIKQVVVQIPSGEQWLDIEKTVFGSSEERAEIMPSAKRLARLSAGRVLIRTTKVDDSGSQDETLWTTTVEEKIAVIPSAKAASLSQSLSVWALVRQVVLGQPWAEDLVGKIDAMLATD